MSKKIIISPFNRVEGDLEVIIDVKDKTIVDVHLSGIMFRGFETILEGRDPIDALIFTPRICGICNISHSVASSNALRNAFRAEMPQNAYFLRNIAHACEMILSHLTHFYLYFIIDFLNKKYKNYPFYEKVCKRFAPMKGTSYICFIKQRRKLLELLGIIVGKWPDTLAFQPGGITKILTHGEIIRALGIINEFKNFLERRLIYCSIERWLENQNVKDVENWLNEKKHAESDIGLFITISHKIGLDRLGISSGKFLSFGAFEQPDGSYYFKSGYYNGYLHSFNPQKITEHTEYSWYTHNKNITHPLDSVTQPYTDKLKAYTWIKAPRYEDNVVEVGPLARLIINRDPLISDYFNKYKSSILVRILARIHEALKLIKAVEDWLKKIDPDKPGYKNYNILSYATGVGLTEAPRGALGHWIIIENGKIKKYQIITPTTWNFSPRDSYGRLGVVEQALLGIKIDDEENPIEIGHIIRSFDPCLVCAVHAFKDNKKLIVYKV